MNRSLRRTSLTSFASVLGAWLAVLVLLAPSVASAGLPYQVQWRVTQENPACETADLREHDGDPFFRVNDMPLPTYQVPDALVTNSDEGSESEAKSIKAVGQAQGRVDVDKAIVQLSNTMKSLTDLGLAGDVERVEIFMPKGMPLKNDDMKITVDGFLAIISTGKRVTLTGFKNFVRVVQL